ncbi:MAG: hypothetical protein WB581_06330 [Halobacteriota archaeon]
MSNDTEEDHYYSWQLKARNPTSLSQVELPYGGDRPALSPSFMLLIIIVTFSLYPIITLLPAVIGGVVIGVLVLAFVSLSLYLSRRTYFSHIHLEVKPLTRQQADKYWKRVTRKNALYWLSCMTAFLLVFLFSFSASEHLLITRELVLLLGIGFTWIFLYTVVLWRDLAISENLSEYYSNFAGFVKAAEESNEIRLPIRCHKGDSHNILLKIIPAPACQSNDWEATLQAAGATIQDAPTQKSCAIRGTDELLFAWNCNFSTSGTHLINLLLRTKHARSSTAEVVLSKSHEVRVITLFRQYATALAGVLIAALTLIVTLMPYLNLNLASVLQSLGIP